MKRTTSIFLLTSLLLAASVQRSIAQNEGYQNLRDYMASYTNPNFPNLGKITVEDIISDAATKHTTVVLSENFIAQPLTPLVVGDLYTEVKRLLPMPFNTYDLTICA